MFRKKAVKIVVTPTSTTKSTDTVKAPGEVVGGVVEITSGAGPFSKRTPDQVAEDFAKWERANPSMARNQDGASRQSSSVNEYYIFLGVLALAVGAGVATGYISKNTAYGFLAAGVTLVLGVGTTLALYKGPKHEL